eukprot:GFYU01042888.1.p1 GENE.GFYU01042888.1~~GFYU01042888.1.p1  ORF type:complete len:218 (-),score=12.38 GFYU01042888.1:96-749(-)
MLSRSPLSTTCIEALKRGLPIVDNSCFINAVSTLPLAVCRSGDGGGGVDDPAFDVESFVGLLSGKGGVNGESVLYGKIGATPTSGTTAEELSASAGVAIKQWKMSRTAHLSSTTQRVRVMSRYALRAVRDLVQEAVNHVEHIMHTINNNSTSTSSPSSTAPLFVQRWRDNHMTIQARGNAAFRHWADLNEYLLLDHTHKNQFIDLSVAPMFRGKRGD